MRNTSGIHLKRNKTKSGVAKPNCRDGLCRTVSEAPLKAALILSLFSLPVEAVEQGRSVQMSKTSDINIASRSSAISTSLAPMPGPSPINVTHSQIPGPLPFDAEALAAAKAAAETGSLMQSALPVPLARAPGPAVSKTFTGMMDSKVSPPDPTGAVGKTRYIELSNSGFQIFDKNAFRVGFGTLANLFGWSSTSTFDISAFDPQVIWDPGKNRFFITGDIIVARGTAGQQHYLAYVFSKTDTPTSFGDFCQYALGPFANFPDYPKLGDIKDFVLIGVNTFTAGDEFIESDIFSISKPPAGTACPDPGTFTSQIFGPLATSLGDPAFTPVPANQIDDSPVGWIVGIPGLRPANKLVLWTIFRDSKTGKAAISNVKGEAITVPLYNIPQNAPQPGTANVLDTSDTRLTQAVSAKNPARGGAVSLWTQHTVSHATQLPPPYDAPSGAEVRWYEIDPVNAVRFSNGKLTSTSRFYFNGSISPNRAVNGTTAKFGDTMVLQANGTSTGILPLGSSISSTYIGQDYPSIFAVSKKGSNAQSAVTTVVKGTLILDDFTCADDFVCRWGDYSALTPDPTPPATAVNGRLWGSNELGGGASTAETSAPWRTLNFIINP